MTESPAPAKTISVQKDGDLEIWVVRGKLPDNFEWALPILARPHTSESGRWFQVHRAGSYSASQYQELCAVLDAHTHCPNDRASWWFAKETIEKFATKHPGITRDFVTRWPGCAPAKVDPEDPDVDEIELEPDALFSASELKFLKKVHFAIGENISWEAFKIIWLAVRKEAIRQLSVDLKPVDLGFARIIAMPYRQNWKEALCVRFQPQRAALSLLAALHRPRDQWHEHFHAMGLFNALASAKLLALNCRNWSKPSARWSLEILPSPDLQRAMEEQEVHREDHLGPPRYAAWLLKQMAKRLNLALEILKHYTENVRLPPGKVKEGNQFGTQILTPMRETGQIRPGTGLCESLQLCPEEAFQKFSDEPAGEENDTAFKMLARKNGHPFQQIEDRRDP